MNGGHYNFNNVRYSMYGGHFTSLHSLYMSICIINVNFWLTNRAVVNCYTF